MGVGAAVNKALQTKMAQTSGFEEIKHDTDEEYVLLRNDPTTNTWSYYGEKSTPEAVVPAGLNEAKRFTREDAMSQADALGHGFKAVPVSQGDMSKGGLLLG